METHQIYWRNWDQVYQKELSKIDKAKFSQNNKDLLLRWHTYLLSTGSIGKGRVSKISAQMRYILEYINKDVENLTLQDIQSIIAYYNTKLDISNATKADYRRAIKQFFNWYKSEDSRLYTSDRLAMHKLHQFYNYLEKDIRISYKKDRINPNDIITDEDIDHVIENGTNSTKERAFLKFLHETGIRCGELLSMKLSSISFNKENVKVTVTGKTGLREIPIITSIPLLSKWIEIHPNRDNPNSYLWIGESSRAMHQPLRHVGASKIIKRCFLKAGLTKKSNLHWFRHSRASILAPLLTEALLCKYLGWIVGSRQIRTYVHLNNQQLESVYNQCHGLEPEQKKKALIRKCACGILNNTTSRYCHKCGRPMTINIAIQDEERVSTETNSTIQFLMQIMKDPAMLKKFEQFKAKEEAK